MYGQPFKCLFHIYLFHLLIFTIIIFIFNIIIIILAAPCENGPLDICGQQRLRSACASAQADQSLCCLLTESLKTLDCNNGEQMPGRDFAHTWDESESVYFAHGQRHLFALRGPYEPRS